MSKGEYPKNMEEVIKLLDNYRVISGGTCQMTIRESAGVDFQQKGKGENNNTDTDKAYQLNKTYKSHCFNCGH